MPIFELYCNKYLYSATVTSDGYVLGCALDTSDKNYRNNPNILSCDIGCIIYNGRMQTLKEIEENLKCEEAHECSLCGGDCKNEMFCKIFSTNVE
jgi:hypoxanthine-guanine phosphoribosyltransferase